MAGVDCRYELRRGDEVVTTGHLSRERPLEIGERIEISRESCARLSRLLGDREVRLVVQLVRDRS
jgi:hypothetical protein